MTAGMCIVHWSPGRRVHGRKQHSCEKRCNRAFSARPYQVGLTGQGLGVTGNWATCPGRLNMVLMVLKEKNNSGNPAFEVWGICWTIFLSKDFPIFLGGGGESLYRISVETKKMMQDLRFQQDDMTQAGEVWKKGTNNLWTTKKALPRLSHWCSTKNHLKGSKGYTWWWSQLFFIFTPTWGNHPIWLIWLIFFNWVETTN